MASPWLKKNPFLSMWLSGAHALTGKAKAAGAAEAGRQRTKATKQATKFWTDAWLDALDPNRRRRR